jgi:hypothetical protein
MSKVTDLPTKKRDPIDEISGCVLPGTTVFVEGRSVPNMTMIDRGETVEFILDHRLMFIFPREVAPLAANFAAQAMAIGAGHPSLSAPHKDSLPYGTIVIGLSGSHLPS